MPVSGIVLTLTAGRDAETLQSLAALSFIELGEREGSRVPGVLEARNYAEHDARLLALRTHDGVAWVDVVFHDFSDVDEFERPPRERDGRARHDAAEPRDEGAVHGPA